MSRCIQISFRLRKSRITCHLWSPSNSPNSQSCCGKKATANRSSGAFWVVISCELQNRSGNDEAMLGRMLMEAGMEFDELYQEAKSVLNPRRLSREAEAGGV